MSTGGRTRHGGRGQALIPVIGLAVLVLLGAGAVTVVGAAHVAAARAQRVADLAALSAVRELAAGLGEAGRVPDAGALRDRLGRVAAAVAGDAGARIERLTPGPDGIWPPASVEVVVTVPAPFGTAARARARAGLRAGPAGAATGRVTMATGGGYAGPLVYRDGKPVCPAVAAAYDLMDAAARADGVDLVVTSGYRGDAEQAVLFARHPDPRWVAPPGRSRHRDATELDIGGAGAWPWLARNAGRFGFLKRYSWEPWHYGYLAGCGPAPAPPADGRASARRAVRGEGDARGRGGPGGAGPWGDAPRPRSAGRGEASASGGAATLPAWVPAGYRELVWRSAAAHGVPPRVLAALLQAESGYRPDAVSPAGALGIAQFMPGTARTA